MKFRITFEMDDDYVDNMEVAESRAFAIASTMESEADMDLSIISVEEVKDDTPMKVTQSIKSYRCEDCANENTNVCDRCMGLNEPGSKPSNWKQKDMPMDGGEFERCHSSMLEKYPHLTAFLDHLVVEGEISKETYESILKEERVSE